MQNEFPELCGFMPPPEACAFFTGRHGGPLRLAIFLNASTLIAR